MAKKGYYKKNGRHSTVNLSDFQGDIMDCLCAYYGKTDDEYIRNALKENGLYDLRIKANRSEFIGDYIFADVIQLLKAGISVEGI